MMWRDTFNLLLSIGTLIFQIALILAVIIRIALPKGEISKFLSRNALKISFLIALAGMAMSLFYSEVVGYAPCELCWYQRIALYPLMPLFGFAWIFGEKGRAIRWTGIVLAGAGAIVSAYQYIATAWFPTSLTCAASQVSCAKLYFNTFGFITIPLMAFTAFIAVVFLLSIAE